MKNHPRHHYHKQFNSKIFTLTSFVEEGVVAGPALLLRDGPERYVEEEEEGEVTAPVDGVILLATETEEAVLKGVDEPAREVAMVEEVEGVFVTDFSEGSSLLGKPVAITVIATSPPMASSTRAPNIILASSFTAP